MTGSSASFVGTRRGRLTLLLLLLCVVQFLDVADSSIMNAALPSIRRDLGFSVQNLPWVLSGYLVTYWGLLLLGGRSSDMLGRRRLLAVGTALFAACSLAGGLAANAGMLIGARLGQGASAALMAPAGGGCCSSVCELILGGAARLLPGERHPARPAGFEIPGAVLGTAGMLLLVYALVRAPQQGWGSARAIGRN